MRLLATATLAAVLMLAACGGDSDRTQGDEPAVDASAALHALFDEHFERNLEMNPLSATFIGDYRYNDRLANTNSPEYRAAATAMDEEFLQRLLEIDREQLGYQDRLSYDIFRINREQSLEGDRFPSHLQPINQFSSMTSFFVQLGSGASAHPFNTVKDYDDDGELVGAAQEIVVVLNRFEWMCTGATAELHERTGQRIELVDRLQVKRELIAFQGLFPVDAKQVVAQLILVVERVAINLQQALQEFFIHRCRFSTIFRAVRILHAIVVSIVTDEGR